MRPDDLIVTIQQLPLEQKMSLLTALMQAINEELRQRSHMVGTDPDTGHTEALLDADGPPPPFAELRGILAGDTPIPADYDWKDEYGDFLTKKYA